MKNHYKKLELEEENYCGMVSPTDSCCGRESCKSYFISSVYSCHKREPCKNCFCNCFNHPDSHLSPVIHPLEREMWEKEEKYLLSLRLENKEE